MTADDKPAASKEMRQYFDKITSDVDELYKIANKARQVGYDPDLEVECPPAHDMAGRVENLVGPKGVGAKIRELKQQGFDQDQITFKICDDIINGEFGDNNDDEKVDRAIRVALAIKTEGVVSAPLEGISAIKIRQDPLGGKPYLALYFAGPIRAAGGTVQAFAVLIADYVADKMNIAPWKATDDEIGRFVEEVKLYDQEVNLQYPSTKAELEFAVKNLRVELNGDPTQDREVAAHRNLSRIETNFVRSGPCLVLNDGVLLKSKKIMKVIKKMKIEGWGWLKKIKELSHSEDDAKIKEAENQKEGEYGSGLYDGKKDIIEKEKTTEKNMEFMTPVEIRKQKHNNKVPPVYKYIADVIGGRPVFSYPSSVGGHRIRYGRSRNTGLAACGMNPNTMYLMNEFLAVGTQIRIERPGKSASVMPVSSIEGPVCLLESGDIVQFNDPNSYKRSLDDPVKKILFIGDILFGYGEFAENNAKLIPSGYVEEWWVLELQESLKKSKINEDYSNIATIGMEKISSEVLIDMIKNPFTVIPTGEQALELSQKLKIPLHPRYTFHYGNINGNLLLEFRSEIKDFYYKEKFSIESETNLKIPINDTTVNFIKSVYCICENHETYYELNEDLTPIFIEIFDLKKNFTAEQNKRLKKQAEKSIGLKMFELLTSIEIRDKSPYYMGSRMGRPEKAKERKMRPPVHALIPLGHNNDNQRVVQNALSPKGVEVDVVVRECTKCGELTHEHMCPQCNIHTNIVKFCATCNKPESIQEENCTYCGNSLQSYTRRTIDFSENYHKFLKTLHTRNIPTVKGVKGLSSEFKMPESVAKGILRAKNEVWVFKDGTIRFDAIDVPFTHFTPNEIGTSVEKLRELGYTKDQNGNDLVDDEQICELKAQDFLATNHCGDYFIRVANFVDDELEYIYNMPRFYNCSQREDLIGHYFAGLAPHTSAAIVGRLIGFSPVTAGYGHPYWHAGKRRNCDGDEDGLLLILDLLINFSRYYLPAKIGGKMDAPLVLSVTLDPNEVDSEAFNVDTLSHYPIEFYEKTWEYAAPGDIEDKMELIKHRLKKKEQYEGIKFTHPTKNINYGPKLSSYKSMATMDEKIDSQLDLAKRIQAVDASDVARKVLGSHFTPDIIGNLRAFSSQRVRCPSCQAKYRRPPLSGKCNKCGNNLILTVHKGGIEKYLNKSLELTKEFDLGNYTSQRMNLVHEYVQSLTDNPKFKQKRLTSYFME